MSNQNKMVMISDLKNKVLPQLRDALPSHISPERFTRVAQTLILNSPHLLTADKPSLFNALIKCAEKGLMPDGEEAALVPVKGKVAFWPGYKGDVKLMRSSGKFKTITVDVVRTNDNFRYYIDEEGTHIRFEPNFMTSRGDVVCAFCAVKKTEGEIEVEIMPVEELEKARQVALSTKKNPGDPSHPWNKWTTEMYKKTVLKRLAKRFSLGAMLFEDERPESTQKKNVYDPNDKFGNLMEEDDDKKKISIKRSRNE